MKLRNYAIHLSLLVALILQIMPLPEQVSIYRPDWVLLMICYWALALPHRVNVGVAFMYGLILDILLGTTLGLHSFAMSVTVFVLAANYQRLRNYSVWHQAVVMGIVTALYHLLVFWLQHLITDILFIVDYLLPVVSSVLLWPWVFGLLRKVRRQLKIT